MDVSFARLVTRTALHRWGRHAQMVMLCEEMGELVLALHEAADRLKGHARVLEEAMDVRVVLESLVDWDDVIPTSHQICWDQAHRLLSNELTGLSIAMSHAYRGRSQEDQTYRHLMAVAGVIAELLTELAVDEQAMRTVYEQKIKRLARMLGLTQEAA